ncbi:autotransporter outer membrane beta-barrel domain-containing protein [Klebsiella pneumoniae]|uniref:autotransporter outer membrane beta-barrel domain-containing protein n=1 Tax=Klebsiella pneumoniae TaxID=573 RepID=UPI0039709E96
MLGDDNAVTDKLIINGNTSGISSVLVNNIGGNGAQTLNGIEIISVNGESDGVFTGWPYCSRGLRLLIGAWQRH